MSRGMYATWNDLPRMYFGDVGVSLLKGGCWCHAVCMPPGTIFLVCTLVMSVCLSLEGWVLVSRGMYATWNDLPRMYFGDVGVSLS